MNEFKVHDACILAAVVRMFNIETSPYIAELCARPGSQLIEKSATCKYKNYGNSLL